MDDQNIMVEFSKDVLGASVDSAKCLPFDAGGELLGIRAVESAIPCMPHAAHGSPDERLTQPTNDGFNFW